MITVIQIHQGGIIIGEANEVMGEVVLKSPRVIQMQQAGPGQVNIHRGPERDQDSRRGGSHPLRPGRSADKFLPRSRDRAHAGEDDPGP